MDISFCFKLVFSTPEGKEVLRHLERFSHAKDFSFCPDERLSEYINGQRSVVAEIKKLIEQEKKKDE